MKYGYHELWKSLVRYLLKSWFGSSQNWVKYRQIEPLSLQSNDLWKDLMGITSAIMAAYSGIPKEESTW